MHEHSTAVRLKTTVILPENPNNVNERLLNIPENIAKTRTFVNKRSCFCGFWFRFDRILRFRCYPAFFCFFSCREISSRTVTVVINPMTGKAKIRPLTSIATRPAVILAIVICVTLTAIWISR